MRATLQFDQEADSSRAFDTTKLLVIFLSTERVCLRVFFLFVCFCSCLYATFKSRCDGHAYLDAEREDQACSRAYLFQKDETTQRRRCIHYDHAGHPPGGRLLFLALQLTSIGRSTVGSRESAL